MTVLSPQGTVYEGRILSVVFPGAAGSFAVLPSHAPIIAALKSGAVTYCTEPGRQQAVSVRSGFVEVNNNRLTVCVEENNVAEQHEKKS